VFLGDLLTYGPDVDETLERVLAATQSGRGVLLRGNHDTLYERAMGDEASAYMNRLPGWINESVAWTRARLARSLWGALQFRDEYVVADRALFSHANPFGRGCWDYLNTPADHARAGTTLRARGLDIGVFGHTHRIKRFEYRADGGSFQVDLHGILASDATNVLNAGAIGQPRDRLNLQPHVLWLSLDKESSAVEFEFQPFTYDTDAYLHAVRRSGLSEATVAKICAFFVPGEVNP
jgi:hypothetical protein